MGVVVVGCCNGRTDTDEEETAFQAADDDDTAAELNSDRDWLSRLGALPSPHFTVLASCIVFTLIRACLVTSLLVASM